MELSRHPVRFLRDLVAVRGNGLRLQFSRYYYRHGAVFDEREVFDVLASEVSDEWFEDQLRILRPGWELALNSKIVDRRNRTYHIGMIDFAEGARIDIIRAQVRNLLGEEMASSMSCFNSGRSFHGYFNYLLRPGQWHEFLGRLLLMNEVQGEPVVDARWIGHRLIGGYCALRWSKNSDRYASYPIRVLHSPRSLAGRGTSW